MGGIILSTTHTFFKSCFFQIIFFISVWLPLNFLLSYSYFPYCVFYNVSLLLCFSNLIFFYEILFFLNSLLVSINFLWVFLFLVYRSFNCCLILKYCIAVFICSVSSFFWWVLTVCLNLLRSHLSFHCNDFVWH